MLTNISQQCNNKMILILVIIQSFLLINIKTEQQHIVDGIVQLKIKYKSDAHLYCIDFDDIQLNEYSTNSNDHLQHQQDKYEEMTLQMISKIKMWQNVQFFKTTPSKTNENITFFKVEIDNEKYFFNETLNRLTIKDLRNLIKIEMKTTNEIYLKYFKCFSI
jgi:hypothetical protein